MIAQLMQMPKLLSYVLIVLGSYAPVPLVLYGSWKIPVKLMKKVPEKFNKYVQRYGCWALLLAIALPFTGFGMWLGVIAARVFDLDRHKSAIMIFIGNAIGIMIMMGFLSGVFMALKAIFT